MRSFVLATRLPYPPRSGADLRSWLAIKGLAGLGQVGVFGISFRSPEPSPLEEIGLWQSSSYRSAIAHMTQPADASWLGIPEWRPSDWYVFPPIVKEVAEALERFTPDLVVLDGLMTAGYLPVVEKTGAMTVLNAHNVETDLQEQIERNERSVPARMVRRRFTERTRLLEADVLSRVGGLWVCSAGDGDLFRERFETVPPATVVPNAVDHAQYRDAYEHHLSRIERESLHLIFPAQFAYPPNRTAAAFLIDQLLPRLSDFDNARLTLAGASPSESMMRSDGENARLTVTGAVDDMLPYLEAADAMVVPLFEGSGTRLKILEAFAGGLPVVATGKAVEGLAVEDGTHVLLADSVDEFIESLRRLADPELRRRLIVEGRALVEAAYGPRSVEDAISASVSSLAG